MVFGPENAGPQQTPWNKKAVTPEGALSYESESSLFISVPIGC